MPLRLESLRSIDSATFTGSYQAIGSSLSNVSVKIVINNATDQPVFISVDGSTDHEYLAVGEVRVIDANSTIEGFPAGTQFYAKGFPGPHNEGFVYLADYYNSLL